MAVKQTDSPIQQYWVAYWRRSLFLVIAMQIIAVLIVSVTLLIAGISDPLDLSFWISLSAILITIVAINCIILTIVTEPVKQLTAALAKMAGERTYIAPPNPNADRYEKSGLKLLLKQIYETSGNASVDTLVDTNDAQNPLISDAFAHSSSSFIIFDDAHNIVFSTKHAPIQTDNDGKQSLGLIFIEGISFDEWLKECEETAVNAEKTWMRVATKIVGEPDRKIYDINVSYSKGSTAPISMVLLEKTNEYAPEDDDLNFIAFAAHELRGPITVIRGYLDTLNDELNLVINDEQRELFQRLIVSSNRLTSYISNILNSSRYDRRHFTVRLVETSIASIFAAISDDMSLRASSQNRILSVDLPQTLPTIAADPSSISEVLGNLIDNAIKYSNEGGVIEVSAEQHEQRLEISVKDHGIGMPANVVSNLFHKFYRSHRSRETVAGTGIGLYITKAIVESNGGTVSVQSVEGEGSTFTVALPIYSSVAAELAKNGGDNKSFIAHNSGSWIKNHGSIRG